MKALSHLQDTLWGLVAQGEHYVLMLRCRDLDVPLVHKVLEAVDQNSPSDVFLSFAQPFVFDPRDPKPERTAHIWLDAVMQALEQQLAGANVLREQDRQPPWPELPVDCWSGTVRDRIDSALAHVGGLFPVEDDHRVLWTFVPTEIGTREAWFAWTSVVAIFLQPDSPHAGHRIVIRVDNAIVEAVEADPDKSALLFDVDFSPEAMANDLVHTALDPAALPKERAHALMQIAGLDYTHRRYAEAARKYGAAYTLLDGVEDSEGTRASCLQAVGHIARMVDDLALAKKRYQQALALSVPQPDTLPVAMNIASDLGDVCVAQAAAPHLPRSADLEEARGYYEIANLIAGKFCNVHFKADVLEKLGIVRDELGDTGGAVAAWHEARDLCVDVQYEYRLASILEQLGRRGTPS